MRRRYFLSGAALAASACVRKRQNGPLREVSVALSEHLSVSSMYLAEESGYLRQAGFQFKAIRLSVLQAIPLLAGGELDVILGGVSSQLLNAVARGMKIRVVAGREYVNPSCGEDYTLYAHRGVFGGGAIDPRRLKGKRFSVRSRGITELVLDTFLRTFGMKPEDVERVDLPLNESLAALAGRKIDALFDLELSRSRLALSPDIVKVWRFADVQPFHQYSFVIFGDSMLRAGLGPGSRFLAAYLQAAGEFLDGRTPRFMRDFAASHSLDVEKTVAECRDTFPRDGAVDIASLQRTIDWHVGKGYATQPMKAEQLIDPSFLEEARKLLASGRWRVGPGTPQEHL
jgi:ABC-type nitrate/sulfonate/bicarbonate transport system substrate-binding protein